MEIFSGTQSISKEFRARGHETFTIDFDEIFQEPEYENTDLFIDILKITPEMILEKFGQPDIIWASPPCQSFSVAAIGRNWTKDGDTYTPKTDSAILSMKIVQHTLWLIQELKPKYWFMENPRGMLRKMDFVQKLDRFTITYCLAGETGVITKTGTYPISQLVGTTPELLTSDGKWVKAPIYNYGKQQLMKISLSRSGRKKEIYATNNHRWLLENRRGYTETKDLKPGDSLMNAELQVNKNLNIINEYVAMGFTYGDGWILEEKQLAFAQFCDEKQELLHYFDGFGGKRWNDDKETCSIVKLCNIPLSWKTHKPSPDDEPSKIFSWIAGYLAADGTVHKNNGQITISSSKKQDLEDVRTLCRAIGIGTYSIVEYWRKGYGKVKTPLYQVTIMRSDVPRNMILRSKHLEGFDKAGKPSFQPRRWTVKKVELTNRLEDVYCADVPETHTFAIEGDILTHNCQYGDDRMKPTDIWHNHPDPQFKPPCKNGAPCHVAAPRGSSTGTQGLKNAIERARIPEEFCQHITRISEQ